MTVSASDRRWPGLVPAYWLAGATLLLAACQSTDPPELPAEPRESAATDPVFGFLTDRYDADRDNVITRAEYDRAGGDFARLDRNEDGLLTESDFSRTGRRVRVLSPREERRRHAVSLLGWYFQDDGDPARLAAAELEDAFRAYDADRNGRVGRTEFEGIAEGRAHHGVRPGGKRFGLLEVETTDPWERILRGVDRDDDGFLIASELLDFHAAHEAGGLWVFDASISDAPAGSLVGKNAPDFTLPTVDGIRRVTLSDFTGDRPVALIFGSWT